MRRLRGAKHTAIGCMEVSAQDGASLFVYWLVRYEVSGNCANYGSHNDCDELLNSVSIPYVIIEA